MTPHTAANLQYWSDLIQQYGDQYYEHRCWEYNHRMNVFPGFFKQEGQGLDVGCGCVSIFEACHTAVVGADINVHEFNEMMPAAVKAKLRMSYVNLDGENLAPFGDSSFDWLACLDMIDYTPSPHRMLAEMYRVLKPSGKMYFQVALSPAIEAPRHRAWSMRTVKEHLGSVGFIMMNDCRTPFSYSATYRK